MPAPFPWGRKSQFSIGGIEVVPETGLEVAYDESPEVVASEFEKPKRKITFPKWEVQKVEWKKPPGFWMGMVIAVFALGIGGGVIFALVSGVKARDGRGASSAQSSSTSISIFSAVETTSSVPPASTSTSTSSSPITLSSSAVPSTFITSTLSSFQSSQSTTDAPAAPLVVSSTLVTLYTLVSVTTSSTTLTTGVSSSSTSITSSSTQAVASVSVSSNSQSSGQGSSSSSSSASAGTNLQTFTGALGGAHAIPITQITKNGQVFFDVQGTDFGDLPSAASHSCILQRSTCEGIAKDGSGSVSNNECLTQFSSCIAATPGATG